MFTIWIDENGYYSTEDRGIFVEVKKIPSIIDVKHLLAYKYNSDTQLLELNETKLEEIKKAIENEIKIPTAEERLADLENAFLEFVNSTLGNEV